MDKCLIIAPNTEEVRSRLGVHTGDYQWLMYNFDVSKARDLKAAIGWVEDINPKYILIGLESFDPEDCTQERAFSKFLEESDIPAHFLLPPSLCSHNVKAIGWSQQLGIQDLWSCELRGKELLRYIEARIAIQKHPEIIRTGDELVM